MLKESHIKFLSGFAVSLFLLLAPPALLACSYAIDPDNPDLDPNADRNYWGGYFFISTWALLLLNIGFAFFSRKQYLSGVVILILAIPVQLFAMFASVLANTCGDSYHLLIRVESGLLLALLLLQIVGFFYKRRIRIT